MRHPTPRRLLLATIPAAVCFLSSGCYPISTEGRLPAWARPRWQPEFGYFSSGVIVHGDFFGEIHGIEPGTGFTIYVPPMWPVRYAYCAGAATLVALPVSLADGARGGEIFEETYDKMAREELTPEKLHHGLSDPTRRYISDFSLDLAISHSGHDDSAFGGRLRYTSLLFGARLAGPRRYFPRYYLCGGLGWHWLRYDARPGASVFGPYFGVGLEAFLTAELALGLEYRMSFLLGDDDAGEPVDGGAEQLTLMLSWYW